MCGLIFTALTRAFLWCCAVKVRREVFDDFLETCCQYWLHFVAYWIISFLGKLRHMRPLKTRNREDGNKEMRKKLYFKWHILLFAFQEPKGKYIIIMFIIAENEQVYYYTFKSTYCCRIASADTERDQICPWKCFGITADCGEGALFVLLYTFTQVWKNI